MPVAGTKCDVKTPTGPLSQSGRLDVPETSAKRIFAAARRILAAGRPPKASAEAAAASAC